MAIVAILATSTVGILAPVLAARAATARQRDSQRHERELNDLAERRRTIFETLDKLSAFDWESISPHATGKEQWTATGAFLATSLRLRALFGADSELARASDQVVAHLVAALELAHNEDHDAAQRMRETLEKKQRQFLEAARPHLLASDDEGNASRQKRRPIVVPFRNARD